MPARTTFGRPAGNEPDPLSNDSIRLLISHAATIDVLAKLGYRVPTPFELAEAARLRDDTLRHQADPETRRLIAEALRLLRQRGRQ